MPTVPKTHIIFVVVSHIIIYMLLLGCSSQDKSTVSSYSEFSRADNPVNKQMVDSASRLLETGDLVLRTGADMTSYMLRQVNQSDKTYSHCGIVVMEGGRPYIYHCIGGEDNPDEKLRRDTAGLWFSPVYNLGVAVARFDMDTVQRRKLVATVHQYYHEQRKFDMDFDLGSDDRLYCAEMVFKAANKATGKADYLQAVHYMGYSFVAIDNLFLNKHVSFICQLSFK